MNPIEFRRGEFPEMIDAALDQYCCPAHRIEPAGLVDADRPAMAKL